MTDSGDNGASEPVPVRGDKAELRDKNRFALLIRSAKLKCDLGEFLCIVRDVSEGGVKLRLFHPLPPCDCFQLELSSRHTFLIEPVWTKGDLSGFRFSASIDIPDFISERSHFPKRALRLNLNTPAIVRIDGGAFSATIHDLSREGVRIETQVALALEQKVTVEAAHFTSRLGTVRWRRSPAYGVALQNLLSFETLALTAARMQLPPEYLEDRADGTDR
jgi:hypothetical protein